MLRCDAVPSKAAQVSPLIPGFIMPSSHQASSLAAEPVLHAERLSASIALPRQISKLESVAELDIVEPLFTREDSVTHAIGF